MTRIAEFMAGAATGIIAAAFILSQPAQAGTLLARTGEGACRGPGGGNDASPNQTHARSCPHRRQGQAEFYGL
jgi:hypothetical protein